MSVAAGYSGTPLAKKLGIAQGARVLLRGAPADYADLLAPLPEGVGFARAPSPAIDVAQVFCTKRAQLAQALKRFRTTLRPDATVWISWPKRAAKVPTDITEDVVREVALPLGYVDVKVCAVDETWSGLKLVVRKALR